MSERCAFCDEPANRGKYAGPCSTCGVATCPAHTYFYIDDSNIAITNGARPTCRAHAERPETITTPQDARP